MPVCTGEHVERPVSETENQRLGVPQAPVWDVEADRWSACDDCPHLTLAAEAISHCAESFSWRSQGGS